MQPVRLSFVFYNIESKWILHRHSAGSPPPHDLERLRTTMQRRVVDFVRVGYFIPLNGPLNGHPPSIDYARALLTVGLGPIQAIIFD